MDASWLCERFSEKTGNKRVKNYLKEIAAETKACWLTETRKEPCDSSRVIGIHPLGWPDVHRHGSLGQVTHVGPGSLVLCLAELLLSYRSHLQYHFLHRPQWLSHKKVDTWLISQLLHSISSYRVFIFYITFTKEFIFITIWIHSFFVYLFSFPNGTINSLRPGAMAVLFAVSIPGP